VTGVRRQRFWMAAAVVLCAALALAIRVIPAYEAVFTPQGVNFQEPDGWFHMRTVHNLMAHFPHRSGFDPYAIFPGGQDVVTSPLWDWMVGWTALLAGLGRPSPALIDAVGAVLPAVLGALFPVAIFWVARTLYGALAGLLGAWWSLWIPGTFLWVTHLGLPDHHAAEILFAFLTIASACAALESKGRGRILLTIAGGCSLGALLATRPAGAFLVPVLSLASFLHPDRGLARVCLGVTAIGAILFLPVRGTFTDFAGLALEGGIAGLAGLLALEVLWTRLNWPRYRLPLALAVLAGLAAAALYGLRPAVVTGLVSTVKRLLGFTPQGSLTFTIQELRPLLRSNSLPPLGAITFQFGYAWTVAGPGLIWAALAAIRRPRPAHTLFVLWALITVGSAFAQVRMAGYAAPCLAVLCGVVCSEVVDRIPGQAWRWATSAIGAALIAAASAPLVIHQSSADVGISRDWRSALDWLARHSPEPLGDPGAWYRFYAARGKEPFPYPPGAYSVVTVWDKGYWIMDVARRIPSANGTQAGATVTARFFTDTNPEDSSVSLRELGGRYVLTYPELLPTKQAPQSDFLGMVLWSSRRREDFIRVLQVKTEDGLRPVPVYLPEYYRTMAVRMARFDGRAVSAAQSWVFAAEDQPDSAGRMTPVIASVEKFASEKDARSYINEHKGEHLILGSLDPGASCVDLDPVPNLRLVFSSRSHPEEMEQAVKVFEVLPR
jgi:oligosaccharyl transferase (archaeosortase A-associated)